MLYRNLGRTGVRVSVLSLGAMNFGAWGGNDAAASARILHQALDSGINLIDTSDNYSGGESEEHVGLALQGRRDDVILATKFSRPVGLEINHQGNSRRWIFREVENSLRRLRTDHIDLYQIHRPLPDTHIDETLGALTDLVRQGKIRYFGSSSFSGSQLVEALWTSEARGRERIVSEQPPYSILARDVERDVLPTALRHGLAVLPWSPLAAGWLSGRVGRDESGAPTARARRQPGRLDPLAPENRVKAEAVARLSALAEEAGLSLVHLALGFALSHPAVTSLLIGPRTPEHLTSQTGAAELVLSAEILDEIDRIVPPGATLHASDEAYHVGQNLAPAARRR